MANVTKPTLFTPLEIPGVVMENWRSRMGYSQWDAAETLGCSRASIQNWERGRAPIPLYIALAMSARMADLSPYGSKADQRKPPPPAAA